jgi:hypothetical protein
MKFSLRELIWLVTIVALSLGVGGYSYKSGMEAGRIKEYNRNIEFVEKEKLRQMSRTNTIRRAIERLNEEEDDRLLDKQLRSRMHMPLFPKQN